MSLDVLPFGIAHHMALGPLAFLALRRERRAAYWWLAGVFLVSWVADSAAHVLAPWLISMVYPVLQAAIVYAVFASRHEARVFVICIVAVGLAAVLMEGTDTPDVFLHTMAWGAVVGLIWDRPIGRLRIALLSAFGAGWLAWIGYNGLPGWSTWGVYQLIRLVSMGLFCWASVSPRHLRVLRAVA